MKTLLTTLAAGALLLIASNASAASFTCWYFDIGNNYKSFPVVSTATVPQSTEVESNLPSNVKAPSKVACCNDAYGPNSGNESRCQTYSWNGIRISKDGGPHARGPAAPGKRAAPTRRGKPKPK